MANVRYINGNPIVLGTSGLEDGAISSAKLGNGCVTNEKLSTSAVTESKIADGAIRTRHVADGALGDEKLAEAGIRRTVAGISDSLDETMRKVGMVSGASGNLFDSVGAGNIVGYYYNESGSYVQNIVFGSTALIPVKQGEAYVASDTDNPVAWFDSSKTFIGGVSASQHAEDGLVTPPEGAAYARFRLRVEDWDAFTVKSSENIGIRHGMASPDIMKFMTSKNLFDIDGDNSLDGYTNTSGTFVPSSALGQTDFIPVKPYVHYFCPSNVLSTFVLFFDSSKNLIGSMASNAHSGAGFAFTTNTNVAFMKFIINLGTLANFYITSNDPDDAMLDPLSIDMSKVSEFDCSEMVWVSFGDSITYRNTWQPYIVDKLGMEHHNCGIGGSPLAGNDANAFWKDARLNAVKSYDPDVVTILGGANDLSDNPIGDEGNLSDMDTSTFVGAYSYIINNLLSWKPSLRIIVLGTTWAHNNGRSYSQTATYDQFSDASKMVADYYGLPFVDLYHNSGFNQYTMGSSPYDVYSRDHIHPNEKGSKIIASQVYSKMKEVLGWH